MARQSIRTSLRRSAGTALPERINAPKIGIAAPGRLAKAGTMPAAFTSPFSVEATATPEDIAVFLRGIDGLGDFSSFMEDTTLGLKNKYLVYGGVALVVIGGGAWFLKRRRGGGGSSVGGLRSFHKGGGRRRRRRR